MQIIEQLCRVLILILLEVTQISGKRCEMYLGKVLILILLEVTQILQVRALLGMDAS